MRHDDFTHLHPHLSQMYGGADLTARLIYEERLRQASIAYQVSLTDTPARSRVSLGVQVGGLLVQWGKWMQLAGTAMLPACSLDACGQSMERNARPEGAR